MKILNKFIFNLFVFFTALSADASARGLVVVGTVKGNVIEEPRIEGRLLEAKGRKGKELADFACRDNGFSVSTSVETQKLPVDTLIEDHDSHLSNGFTFSGGFAVVDQIYVVELDATHRYIDWGVKVIYKTAFKKNHAVVMSINCK